MDLLSFKFNRSGIGGNIGGHLINHLCYADDLCLICLSSAGMQKLLDMCSSYAIEHLLKSLRSVQISILETKKYPRSSKN